MVDWTDAERSAIVGLWGKISVDEIGPQALARLLIVSPWTQRHFSTFGNLSTPAAIMGNPAVAKHGKTVMHGLDRAVQNLDDIKNTYAALSVMHSEKLHVDPDNFRLLADCITVCVAAKLGPSSELQSVRLEALHLKAFIFLKYCLWKTLSCTDGTRFLHSKNWGM
ncbi:hemoglobin subunit beta-like [Salvelinus sp. IW2-2015]|uniref:hemoglobin subunit beta-like n=1 Tax=Salvelinus sp. IW2-2015 TaxID=2691554 RepID=UPI000CEAD07B|nr:hemoglobin subunit beta-like [Salvelinus alpinus]